MSAPLGIGSTVFVFDESRRVYAGKSGGPIWREHWRPVKIVGETSRSWVTDYYGRKLPKKPPLPHGWCADEAAIDRAAWVHDHRHKIEQAVSRVAWGLFNYDDAYAKLQAVAKIVGYSPVGESR